MELRSSDDAKIQDLGIMMETQDNPERISQIHQSKKIPSWGFTIQLLCMQI